MRSPNFAVRKQYKYIIGNILINGDNIGLYYQYAPQSIADNYIIMTVPSHNEIGTVGETKNSRLTVQLKICTKGITGNSGKLADDIADALLNALYPNKVSQIDLSLDGFTCYSTRLVNDTISNYQVDGNLVYIDRTITFEHLIYKN